MGELDRANNNPNERMESGFLSGTTQEFLTPHLRTALERELDKVLREQVQLYLVENKGVPAPSRLCSQSPFHELVLLARASLFFRPELSVWMCVLRPFFFCPAPKGARARACGSVSSGRS